MIPVKSENIYDMALISKIKEHTGSKKLKKILKNLRKIAEDDIKEFSALKVKVFVEEEEKKPQFKIIAPISGFQNYLEDSKKLNSKTIVNIDIELEGENTSSTFDDYEEEIKQADSSDFSEDE